MFKHILLPTDGSDLSDKGVKQTVKMARALGAQITAVHVVHSYRLRERKAFSYRKSRCCARSSRRIRRSTQKTF